MHKQLRRSTTFDQAHAARSQKVGFGVFERDDIAVHHMMGSGPGLFRRRCPAFYDVVDVADQVSPPGVWRSELAQPLAATDARLIEHIGVPTPQIHGVVSRPCAVRRIHFPHQALQLPPSFQCDHPHDSAWSGRVLRYVRHGHRLSHNNGHRPGSNECRRTRGLRRRRARPGADDVGLVEDLVRVPLARCPATSDAVSQPRVPR